MKNSLKKILELGAGIGVVTLLSWTFYDTTHAKENIYGQSQKENRNIMEICKEQKRSDVIDYLIFQEILTNTTANPRYAPRIISQKTYINKK
ncbi:MAG: hypothetical protein AABW65_03300 [Nanoarchaeota archaeon]